AAPGRSQLKHKALAIGIAARLFEIPDLDRCQLSHVVTSPVPHSVPHFAPDEPEHIENFADKEKPKKHAFLRFLGLYGTVWENEGGGDGGIRTLDTGNPRMAV